MSTFQSFLDQIPPLLPPRWLQGGNKETLYAKSLQRTAPHYRRELIADSYGEDLAAYDFIDAPQDNVPCVVLLHGLEGSSRSHYAVELMHAVQAAGWHGVVAHFRSCGGVAAKRLYHSGDTREVAHMLHVLAQRYAQLYVVGVSLGGNALAKYLGEQGNNTPVQAACVVSSPVNLNAAGDALERGLPYVLYTPYFFVHAHEKKSPKSQAQKSAAWARLTMPTPHRFTVLPIKMTTTHARLPCPIYRASHSHTAAQRAKRPILPATYLPTERDVSPQVCLLQPKHGGHCGFVGGNGRGHLNWLPNTLLTFFRCHQQGQFA